MTSISILTVMLHNKPYRPVLHHDSPTLAVVLILLTNPTSKCSQIRNALKPTCCF